MAKSPETRMRPPLEASFHSSSTRRFSGPKNSLAESTSGLASPLATKELKISTSKQNQTPVTISNDMLNINPNLKSIVEGGTSPIAESNVGVAAFAATATAASLQLSGSNSSKSPTSRNLSHVPCKFYRQGACQAGSSCPFSHTLTQTSQAATCKYFQKGTCKFGSKCALVHISPEGKKVNLKALNQAYQVPKHERSLSSSQGLSQQIHKDPETSDDQASSMSSPTRTVTSQMASSPFSNTNSIWSGTGSKERRLSGPSFSTGSFSRGSFSRGSFSNHTVSKAELNQLISGCAISDDEVDGAENMNALGAEDFLPSSLSDLLTPQELKRKNSKSGSRANLRHLFDAPLHGRQNEAGTRIDEDTQFWIDY
ncbi:Zinc finger protein [Komagataella phaffii CBS 7435]|uniref:C3H1-type domain-containing protein n=2 Tax=Komagataella phaffii TaxID=460519 RepID=C4R6V5_KOMPG|nr:Zinc-finger protein of unknown function [Komagataella phaffii GS115]AOA64984.1 GQ67_04414T0 [Komagataella phaffii]CAH2451325.1 Zinc finger protein [Komagataella phaffii CBS 7435]AOA70324.1 GQ68_04386T0 [Komagataella phaffii GS115]CAY71330.1 Zinc-finger protein of unknown function [Komagataella phaffii GS115]CCA41063.1 Zinc finger protein [Komagataella phaffii CBS 7435]